MIFSDLLCSPDFPPKTGAGCIPHDSLTSYIVSALKISMKSQVPQCLSGGRGQSSIADQVFYEDRNE